VSALNGLLFFISLLYSFHHLLLNPSRTSTPSGSIYLPTPIVPLLTVLWPCLPATSKKDGDGLGEAAGVTTNVRNIGKLGTSKSKLGEVGSGEATNPS
jgi:hypothetical protein